MNIDRIISFLNPWVDPTESAAVEDVVPKTELADFQDFSVYGGQDPTYSIYLPYPTCFILYLRNAWVNIAIDHIVNTMICLDFEIRPKANFLGIKGEEGEKLKVAAELAKAILKRPNARGETYADWMQALVRDVLIYDAGFLEKVRSEDGILTSVMPADGSTIRIEHDEHGSIRYYVQWGRASRGGGYGYVGEPALWGQDLQGKMVIIDPKDAIYFKMNTRSNSLYGLPPLLSLVYCVYADLEADRNLHEFLMTGGIVQGFVAADEKMSRTIVNRLRQAFNRAGKAGQRRFIPIVHGVGETKYVQIAGTNREMQIFELQQFMMKKILAKYNVPPNEIGLALGITRGTAWNQQDVFWFNAIYPLARKIEEKLTDYYVAEFSEKLEFKFLGPTEYNFESLMNRVTMLDQQGLIDYEGKLRMLGLPTPKELPYTEALRRLELEASALNNKATEAQIGMQGQQFEQEMGNSAENEKNRQMERMIQTLQLYTTYLDLQKVAKMHEMDDTELEANRTMLESNIMQGQAQIAEIQQMMGQGQEEPPAEGLVTAPMLIGMLKEGSIDLDGILYLIIQERLDPEALEQAVAMLQVLLQIFMSVTQLPNNMQEAYLQEQLQQQEESMQEAAAPQITKAILNTMLMDPDEVYHSIQKTGAIAAITSKITAGPTQPGILPIVDDLVARQRSVGIGKVKSHPGNPPIVDSKNGVSSALTPEGIASGSAVTNVTKTKKLQSKINYIQDINDRAKVLKQGPGAQRADDNVGEPIKTIPTESE